MEMNANVDPVETWVPGTAALELIELSVEKVCTGDSATAFETLDDASRRRATNTSEQLRLVRLSNSKREELRPKDKDSFSKQIIGKSTFGPNFFCPKAIKGISFGLIGLLNSL